VSHEWNRLGEQTQFYAKTIGSIGDVITNYRVELLRAIAQMSLGTGALIMIGGTVVIVGILVLAAANITGQQGWAVLQGVGIEALLGFLGSYLNVRVVAPLIAVVALSATIGAGATAQLGAMRINEEIDALEVIGVRSVSYLASSRVLAGIIVVIPLYCVAVLMSFLGISAVASFESLSPGVYNHYFRTFLSPADMGWSLLVVILCGVTIMLIHTYYGYNATGGPAGVGEAVGRAVRASLVAAIFVIMLATFAIYGYQGNFHLSGG
jgi:phospholipid/cholesterol/gamma-HCH transport system permease protein